MGVNVIRTEYRALALDPKGGDDYDGPVCSDWLEAVDGLRQGWVTDGRTIVVERRTVTETPWRRQALGDER